MRFQLGQLVISTNPGRRTGHIAARQLIEWREEDSEETYKVIWNHYAGRMCINKSWYRLSELDSIPAPGPANEEEWDLAS